MAEINSLIISFPSLPEIKGEFETTKNERLALYDIIINAFMYKYTYEKAKLAHRESSVADKNLDNIKVYSIFLNEVNRRIQDKFLREYVLNTLKNIKENNFNRPSVRKTYETVRKWFVTDTKQGKIFRNNLATGDDHGSIDFEMLFKLCNKQAITENCPLFKDIKEQYDIYKSEYEDLIR